MIKQSTYDPEDGGTTGLQNVSNHSPDTVSHLKRLESQHVKCYTIQW